MRRSSYRGRSRRNRYRTFFRARPRRRRRKKQNKGLLGLGILGIL